MRYLELELEELDPLRVCAHLNGSDLQHLACPGLVLLRKSPTTKLRHAAWEELAILWPKSCYLECFLQRGVVIHIPPMLCVRHLSQT